jgi:hypothetical protein
MECGPEGGMYGYSENKDAYLKRLSRIEGQIRGLQRMVEEDKYCIDILTQVSAATKALQAVALGLLESLRAVTPPRPRSARLPTPSAGSCGPDGQRKRWFPLR